MSGMQSRSSKGWRKPGFTVTTKRWLKGYEEEYRKGEEAVCGRIPPPDDEAGYR